MDNMIVANTVSDNENDGMITPMPGNTTFMNNSIFHNNFINNTSPFIIQGNGVNWDNGFEGNYWSRYAGVDADQNGVGDTPYSMGQDRDNYPLMGPFSEFSLQSNGKTYTVSVISRSNISDLGFESTGNESRISFDVADKIEGSSFCRIAIPTELANYPFTVLVDSNTGYNSTLRVFTEVSDRADLFLYFTFPSGAHGITIVCGSVASAFFDLLIAALLILAAVAVALTVFGLRRSRAKDETEKRSYVSFCNLL
jgi:hypothetical protein